MTRFSPARFFPVLGKELTEQAARKRTYVARVLLALALFVVFGLGLRRKIGEF